MVDKIRTYSQTSFIMRMRQEIMKNKYSQLLGNKLLLIICEMQIYKCFFLIRSVEMPQTYIYNIYIYILK